MNLHLQNRLDALLDRVTDWLEAGLLIVAVVILIGTPIALEAGWL